MIWRHLHRENNDAKVDPSSLIQCPPSYRGGFFIHTFLFAAGLSPSGFFCVDFPTAAGAAGEF